MAIQRFILTVALLSYGLTILAYPQANNFGEVRTHPRTLSGIVQRISVPTNSTKAPPLPPAPIGFIECFQDGQGRVTTDVDGCRPTLNYFRSFPAYRRIQDFKEGRWPKLPSKPPYAIHHELSNCAVQIASDDPSVIDDFSFEQARALATEILEVCGDHGGFGGFAPIGHGRGWRVSVVGFKLPPDPPDGTRLVEGISLVNETLVPVNNVEV